jgi:hypothetical protein
VRRKKSKCPKKKFSKCEERKKNVSVEFRVFGKKRKIERKVPEKNVFGWKKKIKVKVTVAERKKMKLGIFIYWVHTHWLGAML